MAICLNVGRSELRATLRLPRVVAGLNDLAEPSSGHDVAADTIVNVQREAVVRALAALPEPQRRAIVLIDIGGLTAREAAEVESVPRGTILAWVHEAGASWPYRSKRRASTVAHDDPGWSPTWPGTSKAPRPRRSNATWWLRRLLARAGRGSARPGLAEGLRELAPPSLRDRVRMCVEADSPKHPRHGTAAVSEP